jgi:hypothetical protein
LTLATILFAATQATTSQGFNPTAAAATPASGRGRPLGSKNKTTAVEAPKHRMDDLDDEVPW